MERNFKDITSGEMHAVAARPLDAEGNLDAGFAAAEKRLHEGIALAAGQHQCESFELRA